MNRFMLVRDRTSRIAETASFFMAAMIAFPTERVEAQCVPDPTTTWICSGLAYYEVQPADSTSAYGTRTAHLGIDVAGGGDWNNDGAYDVLLGGMQMPFWDLHEGGTTCPWPKEDFDRDRAYLVLGWNPQCATPPPACNYFDNAWNSTIQLANNASAPRGD